MINQRHWKHWAFKTQEEGKTPKRINNMDPTKNEKNKNKTTNKLCAGEG